MSNAQDGGIILYDLASKLPCKAWSLNPWKGALGIEPLACCGSSRLLG